MTLVTATSAGSPSARVVSLKRLEADALVFTTALWTRKVAELRANPSVAAVFFWPALGRQVRLTGEAAIADRELAEELFAERPRSHQLQAHISRQGEPIAALDQLQVELDALKMKSAGRQIACPTEWGAIRIRPVCIEFWQEGAERLHDRLLYERGRGRGGGTRAWLHRARLWIGAPRSPQRGFDLSQAMTSAAFCWGGNTG